MNTPARVVIATRESPLALWQAEHVRQILIQRHPSTQVELLGMTTRGDQILDRTLSKLGGKGLFIKELEVALLEGARSSPCTRRTFRWISRQVRTRGGYATRGSARLPGLQSICDAR